MNEEGIKVSTVKTNIGVADLTTIEGTGPCGPMGIIFDRIIECCYMGKSIKVGVNGAFHVWTDRQT